MTVANPPDHHERGRRGEDALELSNAMVRIYKEHFGRGPTNVRTNYAGDDTILVTLEHTLTPIERSLRDLGEHARLEETRLFFKRATKRHFVGTVETITGRTVRAFVGGTDPVADLACEVFYLEPVGPS